MEGTIPRLQVADMKVEVVKVPTDEVEQLQVGGPTSRIRQVEEEEQEEEGV
jgi:hypothetical protein